LRGDLGSFDYGAFPSTGQKKNRSGGQEDNRRGNHRSRHQLGAGAALDHFAAAQLQSAAVSQSHGIQSQGNLCTDAKKSLAFNLGDGAARHRSRRNQRVPGQVHIFHDDKIEMVSAVGVIRRNAIDQTKLYGSAVRNGQFGGRASGLLSGNQRGKQHNEQKVCWYRACGDVGQRSRPLWKRHHEPVTANVVVRDGR
jgi:hypothetical protein